MGRYGPFQTAGFANKKLDIAMVYDSSYYKNGVSTAPDLDDGENNKGWRVYYKLHSETAGWTVLGLPRGDGNTNGAYVYDNWNHANGADGGLANPFGVGIAGNEGEISDVRMYNEIYDPLAPQPLQGPFGTTSEAAPTVFTLASASSLVTKASSELNNWKGWLPTEDWAINFKMKWPTAYSTFLRFKGTGDNDYARVIAYDPTTARYVLIGWRDASGARIKMFVYATDDGTSSGTAFPDVEFLISYNKNGYSAGSGGSAPDLATTPNGNGLSVYYRGSTDGGASYGSWVQTTVIGNPTHISGGNVMDDFTENTDIAWPSSGYTAEFGSSSFNSYSGAVTDVRLYNQVQTASATFPITTAPLSVLQPVPFGMTSAQALDAGGAYQAVQASLNASRPVVLMLDSWSVSSTQQADAAGIEIHDLGAFVSANADLGETYARANVAPTPVYSYTGPTTTEQLVDKSQFSNFHGSMDQDQGIYLRFKMGSTNSDFSNIFVMNFNSETASTTLYPNMHAVHWGGKFRFRIYGGSSNQNSLRLMADADFALNTEYEMYVTWSAMDSTDATAPDAADFTFGSRAVVGGTWVEQTFVNAHDDALAVFGSNSANYFSVGSGQASLAINGNGAQTGGPGSGTFEAFRLYNAKLTPSSFDDDNPHTIGHSVLAVGYFAWQASPYVVVLDNDHTTPQYVALPWNTPASASAITPLGAAIPKPATGGSTWGGTVAISADGTCVAIGNNGHATPGMLGVWKWNGASWARLGGDLETMAEDYAGVALSADGSRVIIGDHSHGSSTGRARLFQYNDATDAWDQLREWSGTHSASYGARSVAISEDGELVAIGDTHTTEGNSHGRVRIYRQDGAATSWTPHGETLYSLNPNSNQDHFGNHVSFSADGTRLAVSAEYRYIVVYDYDGGTSKWTPIGSFHRSTATHPSGTGINFAYDEIYAGKLSADGNSIALVAANARVPDLFVYEYDGSAWTQKGSEFASGHIGNVPSVYLQHHAINHDGTRIVMGGDPGSVYDWDGTDWAKRTDGGVHEDVAMTPDGTRMIGGRSSGAVQVYTLPGPPSPPTIGVFDALQASLYVDAPQHSSPALPLPAAPAPPVVFYSNPGVSSGTVLALSNQQLQGWNGFTLEHDWAMLFTYHHGGSWTSSADNDGCVAWFSADASNTDSGFWMCAFYDRFDGGRNSKIGVVARSRTRTRAIRGSIGSFSPAPVSRLKVKPTCNFSSRTTRRTTTLPTAEALAATTTRRWPRLPTGPV